MKIKFFLIISIIFLISLMITSCSKAPPTSTSDGNISLDPTILAFASPMAENLLIGLKNNDIQAFRANYDDAMLKATTEDAFQSLRTQLESQLGAYQSITPKQIQAGGGFINVFYTVNFEKGPLTMQLVLTETEPHQISGLWFK
jgi:hypothetical protein